MDEETIRDFEARIATRLGEIEAEEAATAADRAPVTLDQQSVGRLSRMDAMQVQAMAKAQSQRRAAERQRLAAALRRIEEGEFGYCIDCGEEIGRRRLELDPGHAKCVDCAGAG
jgi:DnaK suppressor protein